MFVPTKFQSCYKSNREVHNITFNICVTVVNGSKLVTFDEAFNRCLASGGQLHFDVLNPPYKTQTWLNIKRGKYTVYLGNNKQPTSWYLYINTCL